MLKIKYQDELTPALNRLSHKQRRARHYAYEILGPQIMTDILSQAPRPPILTGELRETWFLFIDGELSASGPQYDGSYSPKGKGIVYGFSSPYAAIQELRLEGGGEIGDWHKGPISSEDPGVGGGFITQTIYNNAAKYENILAKALQKYMES